MGKNEVTELCSAKERRSEVARRLEVVERQGWNGPVPVVPEKSDLIDEEP